MNPHLQHRALCHVGQHNRFPSWASTADRATLADYVQHLGDGRYQLNETGWGVLTGVIVSYATVP